MTIAEKRALRASKVAEAKALLAPESPSDADVTKAEALNDEAETLAGEIEGADRVVAARERANAAATALGSPSSRRVPAATAGNPLVARPAWLDDPKRGYKSHSAFLKDVMLSTIGARPAKSENLRSLEAPVMPGYERDAAAGSDEHSTFDNARGGFLVPEAWDPTVKTTALDQADPTAGTTKIPMATPILRVRARVDKNHATSVSGGLRVYRRAESGDPTASRMEFEELEIKAYSLWGVSYATEELLTDSAVSFLALLEQGFRDEFASQLISEKLFGDGVGKMLGAFHASNPSAITVAAEGAQTADTINYTNIVKMRARCWGYQNAVWIVSHDAFPSLATMNASGTGSALIWQPSAREGSPDTLLGRPLIVSEYAKAIGDLNDIMLVNWTQYLEGTLQPLQNAESVHVRFLQHERTFKFWMRNGGLPWWRAPITPKNGATVSPFVNLAAR